MSQRGKKFYNKLFGKLLPKNGHLPKSKTVVRDTSASSPSAEPTDQIVLEGRDAAGVSAGVSTEVFAQSEATIDPTAARTGEPEALVSLDEGKAETFTESKTHEINELPSEPSGIDSGAEDQKGASEHPSHPAAPAQDGLIVSVPSAIIDSGDIEVVADGPQLEDTAHEGPVLHPSTETSDAKHSSLLIAQEHLAPDVDRKDDFEITAFTSSQTVPMNEAQSLPPKSVRADVDQPFEEPEDERLDDTLDLVHSIKGMYRILDLVSESATGGLVDKIIICQESFGRFANDICPGSYRSMTRVDFTQLDAFITKPLGIYGSKSEIVQFLKDLGAVDDDLARLLVASKNDTTQHTLRSGLYFLRTIESPNLYVIYWPEETTWNDNAITSVQRNRIAFMRYLTKTTDQAVALISRVHADALVCSQDTETDIATEVRDGSDRFFSFRVEKTKEQEENVTTKPGFQITDISRLSPVYLPQLIRGETSAGIMTTRRQERTHTIRSESLTWSFPQLQSLILRGSYTLDTALDEESLQILLNAGLQDRASEAVGYLRSERQKEEQQINERIRQEENHIKAMIQEQTHSILATLYTELTQRVVSQIRSISVNGVEPPDITLTDRASLQNPELIAHLCSMYPQFKQDRDRLHSDDKLADISSNSKAFADCKERLSHLRSVFDGNPGLSIPEQQQLIDTADTSAKETKGGWISSVKAAGSKLLGLSHAHLDDQEFLNHLPELADRYPILSGMVENAKLLAEQYFSSHIKKEANRVVSNLEHMQRDSLLGQRAQEKQITVGRMHASSRTKFIEGVQQTFLTDNHSYTVINKVQRSSRNRASPESYYIETQRHEVNPPTVHHSSRVLQLTEDDKQSMRLEHWHIPSPRIPEEKSFRFDLPVDSDLIHIQLLHGNRCLLVVSHNNGSYEVYCEHFDVLHSAIRHRRHKKILHKEKLGEQVLLAYDETKRMLCVCSTEKLTLYSFVFDELYDGLQGLGSSFELESWYETRPRLSHMIIRGGNNEELAFVDNGRNIRIYSLASRQFWPTSLPLQSTFEELISSPDAQ